MRAICICVLGWAFIACALPVVLPPPDAYLESVRSTFESAAGEPDVREYAPHELAVARDALQRADSAWRAQAAEVDVRLLSYRVRRLVRISRWAADRRAAGEDVPAVSAAVPRAAELESDFADLEARYLDVRRSERGPVVTLDRALFAPGAELKPMAREMLDRLAQFLAQHPDRRVEVEGHTDDMGGVEYNQRNSRERAESAARYLRSRGIAADRLAVAGYGMSRPLVPNTSTVARRLNRRVDIVIERASAPSP